MNDAARACAVELFGRLPEFLFRLIGIAGLQDLENFAVLTSDGSFYRTVPCAFFLALTKPL